MGQVTTFDLKHLTWNAEKRQISVCVSARNDDSSRAAESRLSLRAQAVCVFPY